MRYDFRCGYRAADGITAQTAGEVCSQLDTEGRLNAQTLVDVSRDEDAPLHKAFEWDDSIAGEEWRKHQARGIINAIILHEEMKNGEPVQVRAFFKLDSAEGGNYENVSAIIRNEDKSKELFKIAMRELDSFKHKYSSIQKFAQLFAEIDKLKSA